MKRQDMLIHRDYSFSASALISIYTDRMEFVSVGGLMPGIELEDILAGISVCRNQDLANVFYRLRLIEAYGAGMGKIMKAYEGLGKKPRAEITKNTFKLILPNINYKDIEKNTFVLKSGISIDSALNVRERLTDTEEKILDYARSCSAITKADVMELLGTSASTATRVLRKMVNANLLKRNGKARNTNYTINPLD